MTRRLALLALLPLGGCDVERAVLPATNPPSPPPSVVCPPATLIPPSLPRVASSDYLAQLAADLQRTLAKERARGDACAEAVRQLKDWGNNAH